MNLPEDVVKQMIGGFDDWDEYDTMVFGFTKPSKFPEADSASVNFEEGIVRLLDENGETIKTFNIKAELVEQS